jgi:hypothetical protein
LVSFAPPDRDPEYTTLTAISLQIGQCRGRTIDGGMPPHGYSRHPQQEERCLSHSVVIVRN